MGKAASASDRTRARLGASGLAVVFAAQFICFSLCGSGVSASIDPQTDCHQSASTAAPNGAASSLTSPNGNCCSDMDSQTVAEFSSRDSLSAPQSAVSAIAPFADLHGQATALGSATTVSERNSSPPRSPILRI